MRIIRMAIFLVATIMGGQAALCQCGEVANLCKCVDPPSLAVKGHTIFVSGEAVHLSGNLPSKDERWFYSITCHTSSRIFNFSLWTVVGFAPRPGLYFAKSWNLQISDAKDSPERQLTFDRENDFYFWGNVDNSKGVARVSVDNIVGLPTEFHGTFSLPEIQSDRERAH